MAGDGPFKKHDKDNSVIVRTDEVKLIRQETVNSQKSFEGRAVDMDTLTSDPLWQIKRITTQNGQTITEFANQGAYNVAWDDRDAEGTFPAVVFDNPASLLFDGSDEYITLGDNYTFGPAIAFSWSFWMKAQNLAAQRAFIAKTSQDLNVYGYSFQHNSSGKLFAQFRAPSTLRQHTFSSTLNAGQWYHICFTYAGGSNMNGLTGYIDSIAESSVASATLGAWTVTDPLMIARRGTTFHFSGNMNNVSVWNKELSGAEVTEIYNSGAPSDLTEHSAVASLLSWWKLNSSSSFPTEVDAVDTINGTLVNMEEDDYDEGDVP